MSIHCRIACSIVSSRVTGRESTDTQQHRVNDTAATMLGKRRPNLGPLTGVSLNLGWVQTLFGRIPRSIIYVVKPPTTVCCCDLFCHLLSCSVCSKCSALGAAKDTIPATPCLNRDWFNSQYRAYDSFPWIRHGLHPGRRWSTADPVRTTTAEHFQFHLDSRRFCSAGSSAGVQMDRSTSWYTTNQRVAVVVLEGRILLLAKALTAHRKKEIAPGVYGTDVSCTIKLYDPLT